MGRGKDNIHEYGEATRFTSGSRAVEAGRKGGIKAAEKRKEKKNAQEIIKTFLSMPLKGGKVADVDNIKNFLELKGKNITVEEAMFLQVVQKALKGDLRAIEMMLALTGEKPAEKVQVENVNPMSELTTEELRKLIDSNGKS